jgi:hypothetical protein
MNRSLSFSVLGGLALVTSALAFAACSSSSSVSNDAGKTEDTGTKADTGKPHSDAGTKDTGKSKDTGTHEEASKSGDAGLPFSVCGKPGEMGNSLGVGLYCGGDAGGVCANTSGAPICSAMGNSDGGKTNSFFCLNLCMPCTDASAVCGAGASCECLTADLCGCVPTSCGSIIPDAGAHSCDAGAVKDGAAEHDAGTKDAGTAGH